MRKLPFAFLLPALLSILLGFTFSLDLAKGQFIEYGIATVYSDLFEGRTTASGEIYQRNKMTAAHKSLDFGTLVKVTRLDDPKKSVIVRINDRGAFPKGRVVDLSYAAAKKLGMLEEGTANVKLEIIKEPNASLATTGGDVSTNTGMVHHNESPVTTQNSPKAEEQSKAKETKKDKAKSAKQRKTKSAREVPAKNKKSPKRTKAKIVTGRNFKDFDLYKVMVLRPEKKGFGVQVALLRNYDNVFRFIADLQENFFKNILLSIENGPQGDQYRVILGPFDTKERAQSYRNHLEKKKKIKGFVLDLSTLQKTQP